MAYGDRDFDCCGCDSLLGIVFFASAFYVASDAHANSGNFIEFDYHGKTLWRLGIGHWVANFNFLVRFLQNPTFSRRLATFQKARVDITRAFFIDSGGKGCYSERVK